MTAGRRPRGLFEGLPRFLYRRTGRRYLDACAALIVLNGLVVGGVGLITVALYVDLDADELALFAACSLAGYAAEGLAAAALLRRTGRPIAAWLAGARDPSTLVDAWAAAAFLPLGLVRRHLLYAIGIAGACIASLVLAV